MPQARERHLRSGNVGLPIWHVSNCHLTWKFSTSLLSSLPSLKTYRLVATGQTGQIHPPPVLAHPAFSLIHSPPPPRNSACFWEVKLSLLIKRSQKDQAWTWFSLSYYFRWVWHLNLSQPSKALSFFFFLNRFEVGANADLFSAGKQKTKNPTPRTAVLSPWQGGKTKDKFA